jgi:hypothetical protein
VGRLAHRLPLRRFEDFAVSEILSPEARRSLMELVALECCEH